MAKELIYLKCAEWAYKSQFLQHVYELHQVPITENDTYNQMFDKLEDHFKGNEEGLAAAKDWIAHNREDQEDQSVFDSELLNIKPDPGIKVYAIFDLQPER